MTAFNRASIGRGNTDPFPLLESFPTPVIVVEPTVETTTPRLERSNTIISRIKSVHSGLIRRASSRKRSPRVSEVVKTEFEAVTMVAARRRSIAGDRRRVEYSDDVERGMKRSNHALGRSRSEGRAERKRKDDEHVAVRNRASPIVGGERKLIFDERLGLCWDGREQGELHNLLSMRFE
jgi:hypothetical protein